MFMHMDKKHFDIAIPILETDADSRTVRNPMVISTIVDTIRSYLENPIDFSTNSTCYFDINNKDVFMGYKTCGIKEVECFHLKSELEKLGYKAIPEVTTYKQYQKYKWKETE